MSNYNYVGKDIPFIDAAKKVDGSLEYISDIEMANMLHMRLYTARIPRGKIKRIDTSRAGEVAGVRKIYTFRNTPQKKFNGYYWFQEQEVIKDEVLLTSYVRHVGDRVAAIVAETAEAAEKARDLLEVEYETEEPPLIDPLQALKSGDALHERGNPFAERNYEYGAVDRVLAETPEENIFSDRVVTPKVHHLNLENHACLAYPGEGEGITVISPCQLLYSVRLIIAHILELPFNRIRVIKANTGGSFGAKQETFLEPLVAYAAGDLNQPVKIEFNRRESILSTRTRSKIVGEVTTAVSDEGKIQARDIEVIVDAGAYTSNGNIVSAAMAKKISRLYKIENQRYHSLSVHTTTPPGGPCRGYGSPQIHTITEINLDRAAKKLGIDRVELRLKNLLQPHEEDLLGGPDIGNARIIEALKKGRDEFDWAGKKESRSQEGRYRRGIGVACATHVNGYYDVYPDYSGVNLRFYEDGSLLLNCALHELGHGTRTIMAQIAGEVLGINPGQITVLEGDTERSPYDVGCHASRGTYVIGRAVQEAAEKLRDKLIAETAELFNVSRGEITPGEGLVEVAGKSYDYSQIIGRIQHENQVELNVNHEYQAQSNPASYGAHYCQVEVDSYTGLVEITDYVAVHDVGRAINPQAVKTQIAGGVQMGIGLALMEEIGFDEEGYPLNTDLSTYLTVNAPDMPGVRSFLVEEGGDDGPYGAKSIGEIATVPVAAAVVNAVNDALGTYLTELPLTPPKIAAALKSD